MKQKFVLTLCAGAALSLAAACSSADVNPAANVSNRANANVPANSSNMNANTGGNMNAMSSSSPAAGENPMVGGAAMLPTRDIIDNAVNSKDHTTLVTAVKAAGLVDTLKGAGPFTVFAPTNAAFDKLPKGEVEGLLKPGSKATLTKILTYHAVSGRQDAAAITKAIEAGGGKATFKTLQGGTLTASLEGKSVVLTDEKGGKSTVTIPNVNQSNGVIHVVDTVLMPK